MNPTLLQAFVVCSFLVQCLIFDWWAITGLATPLSLDQLPGKALQKLGLRKSGGLSVYAGLCYSLQLKMTHHLGNGM